MGWERKRGKLAEFNRLLRGALRRVREAGIPAAQSENREHEDEADLQDLGGLQHQGPERQPPPRRVDRRPEERRDAQEKRNAVDPVTD